MGVQLKSFIGEIDIKKKLLQETIEPVSLAQFADLYHNSIRLAMSWHHLREQPTGTTIFDQKKNDLLLLHSEFKCGDTWMGEFRRYRGGKDKRILRVPAMKYGQSYLLLDGNHRIQFYEPSIIILDYIEPSYFCLANYIDQGDKFVRTCRAV